MNEQDIFTAALQKSPDTRPAFLDEACAGDLKLRERIERLLEFHQASGGYFEKPAAVVLETEVPRDTEQPGDTIGPYKLLQKIGEGGMGVVYMAEQTEPVERRVALKIIKPGMDTRQVIARFEAERQALALMDHPNIAKVLDAGTTGGSPKSEIRNPKQDRSTNTESARHAGEGVSDTGHSDFAIVSDFGFRQSDFSTGRPYFVMELVKGLPITQYCDEQHLTPRERLELFLPVCQAVQHAHQKGIIHRDLKPSNVLVTVHDDQPVVKVIDFGIAKATSGQLTDKTLFTGLAQMVGTPLYMSPEQAALSGIDVDTRSDIYSLGVLLYELLTGTTPFDKSRLQEAAFDEVRRIIREEEPQKPSTRLSDLSRVGSAHHQGGKSAPGGTSGGRSPPYALTSLASVAALRKTEPRKLTQLLRGDLDWIVMKALEKDRARRYETANGFAADVLRYLADEPVSACPPSAAYRFRKFARRNKAALATGALISATLVVAVVVLAVSNVLITAERNAKDKALAEKVQALGEKETALEEKQAALEQSQQNEKAYKAQLLRADENLRLAIDKGGATVMDMGYQACLALFQDLTFHQYLLPEESNAARQSLQVYLEFAAVNNNDQSASLESVTASERLSFLQLAFGEYRAAEQTLRPTVALLEDLARKKPTVTEYGWKLVNCYQNLAMALEKLNRCSEAEQAYRHSLRLDADVLDRRDQYPFAADARVNQRLGWGRIFFGRLLLRTGRLTEAEAAFRQGLMFGNSPFTRSFAMEGLARVFQSTDRLQEAEDGYRAVCQLWEQQLTAAPGNRHFQWKVAFASLQLGEFYEATGRDNEAGKEYRRALKIWEDLASEYASVPAYLRQQAWFLAASPLLELRNPARAVDLAKKAVELAPNDGNNWATLAAAHYRTGNWSEAQVALEKAMNLRPWGEGLDWFLLAMTQWRLGNTKGARQWFDKAVEWMAKNDAYNDDLRRLRSEAAELPDVAISREALVAEVLRRRAALDERAAAAPAARWERRQLAFDYYQHAVALRDVEQLSESEAVCRRALDAFRVLADEDPREIQFVYDIGWASHLLSDVLVRCRRFEEAAPLAREALARFQAVADSGPDRLEYRDAIAVAYAPLANLLAQLNQPEEAAQAQRDAEAARQAAEELRRTMPSARELLDSARPFAEKRDWTKAAAELNRGGEWQRSDLFLCFSTALARLLAGDIDGYARLVGGMQGLVPWKGSRWSRLDFLRTCTMHPRGAADPAALVPLARSACDEEANNWSAQNLAMVHYRAGEFDEALRWMERAQELGEWYLFFPALAMTHHQLGRSEEARLWLDKANTFFRDFAPPDGERLETLQGDPHWQDWAYFEVMLREARTLIGETGDLTETMLRSALRSRAEQPMIRDN